MKALILVVLIGTCTSLQAAPGYFRDPAIHQGTLVFTAEGDLWRASLADSSTRRLTTHPAEEKEAAISPDGNRWHFQPVTQIPAKSMSCPWTEALPAS